jgi:glutathione S-transferase
MSEWLSLEEARESDGLRLVMLRGLPSPWSQAARGILDIKGLRYSLASRGPDDPDDALEDWTGQSSYPALMYADERPRSGWAEILLLAERLKPEPALIPADPGQRALLFGLAHEICGEMGLGWCRRLVQIAPMAAARQPGGIELMRKYGSGPEGQAVAQQRVVEVLTLLRGVLRERRAAGQTYLMGELTALDVYWATFCTLLSPLPPEQLPMPPQMRPLFSDEDPEVQGLLAGELLELRDLVYAQHLRLPVEL